MYDIVPGKNPDGLGPGGGPGIGLGARVRVGMELIGHAGGPWHRRRRLCRRPLRHWRRGEIVTTIWPHHFGHYLTSFKLAGIPFIAGQGAKVLVGCGGGGP
jgi:hypothetical protein